MRKTLLAAVLVLALCPIALAGEMGTPPIAPKPQSNSTQVQSTDDNSGATIILIQTVLDLIVSVLP